jgi:hypothetical protein
MLVTKYRSLILISHHLITERLRIWSALRINSGTSL